MATGKQLLDLARRHIGERYISVQVPKDNPNWKGPWDSAEFVSWLVYQTAGILYGCIDNVAPPTIADAYLGAWQRDSATLGRRIPVAQAAATQGAIVLRLPPHPGAMGHIAISDGQGGTVEAKAMQYGVVADMLAGRRWDIGLLVPGLSYEVPSSPIWSGLVSVFPPSGVLRSGGDEQSIGEVGKLQSALATAGFNPGAIDGRFGPATAAAVAAFQAVHGLVVDGEVGPTTRAALRLSRAETPRGKPAGWYLGRDLGLAPDRPTARRPLDAEPDSMVISLDDSHHSRPGRASLRPGRAA